MNGPVKHGATSDESFIMVNKMVFAQRSVESCVLKSIRGPFSFYGLHKSLMIHVIRQEHGMVIPANPD